VPINFHLVQGGGDADSQIRITSLQADCHRLRRAVNEVFEQNIPPEVSELMDDLWEHATSDLMHDTLRPPMNPKNEVVLKSYQMVDGLIKRARYALKKQS